MTDPSAKLVPAIDHIRRNRPRDVLAPPGNHRSYSVGILASAAGQAAAISWAPTRQSGLVRTAAWAVWWISEILDVPHANVWEMVRAEYSRRHAHSRYHPGNTDDDWADWLIVLVGVVADNPADHVDDLADALLQVAAMATVWLARTLDAPATQGLISGRDLFRGESRRTSRDTDGRDVP
ncbi:hypothetical protein [Actinomyces sp.]|uniref:hypothetical protein n=1 Tax=Actinomyces sp. TaxID=29317 RepID=UPI0026DBFF59|nr:hypothetical protein [Actinomyces sp.]MDO4900849.1 hypothetical protein [Actinomyces sp.]